MAALSFFHLLFVVPVWVRQLSLQSCSFSVLQFGMNVQVELLGVSPGMIIGIVGSTLSDILYFWIEQGPSTASVLASSWRIGPFTHAYVVAISQVWIVVASPLACI